ncbi:MAG: metallophosphoesterase family protein, partial [Solirubrobacterales bacterium]
VAGQLDIGTFSSSAAAAARWTAEVISQSTLEALERLEPVGERDGVGMYHGSPRDPVWEYVMSSDQARAALRMQSHSLALVGHSHVACWFRERGESLTADYGAHGSRLDLSADRWIVNPGSVGQPRDGDSRAAYLLLDTDAKQASFGRVEYPIESAARSILDAGLPRQLADRLYLGQ